jgi:hypothetical protein
MMAWDLDTDATSMYGEHSGSEAKPWVGYEGSRFSIKGDNLSIKDYERQKTESHGLGSYIQQIRKVLGVGWGGGLRIRANGDTYCARGSKKRHVYVGKTSLGTEEHFPGYVLGAKRNLPISPPAPSLFSGPNNRFQVGERWTVPGNRWADGEGRLGKIGKKFKKGDWMWTESPHNDLIEWMHSTFHYKEFLPVYITCYGYIVHPLSRILRVGMHKFDLWERYGIDVPAQFEEIARQAPSAAHSMRTRINNIGLENPNIYFVCGHIDDIMGGRLPHSDKTDERFGLVNQDKSKWN